MVICSVPNCLSRSDRERQFVNDGSKIGFHRFPKESRLRTAWLLAIRRRGEKPNVLWSPKKTSHVCSRHFIESDFKQGLKNKILLRTAIPSVFTEDVETFPRKKSHCSQPRLNGKSTSSQNLAASNEDVSGTKEAFISKENEINRIVYPLDVNLLACPSSGEKNNCASTTNNFEIDNLPPFMKQALMQKEKIDRTYNNAPNIGISMKMEDLQYEESETNNEFLSHVDSSNKDDVPISNSNVPYSGSPVHTLLKTGSTQVYQPVITGVSSLVPQNSTNNPCVFTNNIFIAPSVKMCDASTSTVNNEDVEKSLKKELERCNKRIAVFRKKCKTLQQMKRRSTAMIMNMKHNVFCELAKRRYLSNKEDYNSDKEGCLLDRHSVKKCESSDSEEFEEG